MKVNLELYSQRALEVFQTALKLAAKMGHGFLGSEHLLWALTKEDGRVQKILLKHGLDDKLLEEYVRRYDGGVTQVHSRAIQISGEADEVLYQTVAAARENDREKAEPSDLLVGILKADQCAAAKLLRSLNVSAEELKNELEH